MKKQELTGKSDTEKKGQVLRGRSAQRGSDFGGLKLEDYFQQISPETSPESFTSILTSPEFSHPVNASQKVNMISHIQQIYGNKYLKSMIQAKLKISQPNDKYEQEADRVADKVMRMPEPQVQQQLDEEIMQPKETARQTSYLTSDLEPSINVLKGRGRPLPKTARAYFEPRFGCDFSMVRVHSDLHAAETAKALKARAFTINRDVVFGTTQYAPETAEGKRLLAHELTHVLQQSKQNSLIARKIDTIEKKFLENIVVPETGIDYVTDYQIMETEEFKSYMDPENVWQIRDKVTEEEAPLACRLILDDISLGMSIDWYIWAKYYIDLTRQILQGEYISRIEQEKTETVVSEEEKQIKKKQKAKQKVVKCGEYDDATIVISFEGKEYKKKVKREVDLIPIPSGKPEIWNELTELRYIRKGRCCEFVGFRVKSPKTTKWILDVTPLRAELRYGRNLCTGESGGIHMQLSSQATISVWESLRNLMITESKWWMLVPNLTLNLVIGLNIFPLDSSRHINIVRLIPFITTRVDASWEYPFGRIAARQKIGICKLANIELGEKSVFEFTTDYKKCIEDLFNIKNVEIKLEPKTMMPSDWMKLFPMLLEMTYMSPEELEKIFEILEIPKEMPMQYIPTEWHLGWIPAKWFQ